MDTMYKPIDRATWEMMWANLQGAGKQMSLNAYAAFCDRTKRGWCDEFGPWGFSNGRYIVHVEEQLHRGFRFPGNVTNDDMKYDAPAFPLTRAALTAAKAGQ